MVRHRLFSALLFVSAAAGLAVAQGPKDVFLCGFNPGTPEMWISQAGAITPLTGTTPAEQESDSCAYDPWDASLLLGGTGISNRQIRRVQYNAAGAMVSSVLLSTLPAGANVNGLAVSSNDGQIYASSGDGGYRVDPSTGAAVRIAGPMGTATYNCVVVGPRTGNVYFGQFGGAGNITMVPKGGGPEIVLGVTPLGAVSISGIAVDPGENNLYVAGALAGGFSLVRFPLPGGPGVGIPTVPALPALNDVEWDHSKNRLVVCSRGVDPDNVWDVDPVTGMAVLRAQAYPAGGGTPANVDINDSGEGVKLIPEKVPAGPFTLCISLWGRPGDVGKIYILAAQAPGGPVIPYQPAPLLIAKATIDFRGCLALRIPLPAGIFTPGGPNIKFHLVGMFINPGGIRFSQTTTWPAQ